MRKSKHRRLLATIVTVFVLLSTLSACQKGKKFESTEAMVSEMKGTYSGSDEHSGERIVIDGNNVIKFNVAHIFPEITDENFFWENFPNESWESFDIDALLRKPYIKITSEPISANIKDSTVSGLWVNKDGVLFSSRDGYRLNKISSDSVYPTTEMQEKFEEYLKYLKEYEASAIVAEAESNFSEKQESLNTALSSATSSTSTSQKSTATAETIAECAFESIKDYLRYPRTATLESYSTSPQYDPYGRVCTLIAVTAQNGFGNYITEDYYVVLQSCSYSGYYTYNTGGMHYTKDKNYLSFLLNLNGWNEDPSTDNSKEDSYNEAIQLIKNKKYSLAVNKLEVLGDYKSAIKLKDACISFSHAEQYKKAIVLFAEGKYADAKETLSSLLQNCSSDYLKAKRVIALCNAAINTPSDNNGNPSQSTETQPTETQPSATQPPATQPPATQSPATQPPAVCSHNYTDATCTKPRTCTLCGQTSGSALGHTYSAATCTAPKTCNSCGATSGSGAGHKWTNITQTVRHEEQGHYEDVEVVKYVEKYKCFACSNKSNSLEDYYSHFDSVHGNSNHYLMVRERYEIVNDKVYEYETQWVVDKEAYTETVVTGRKCDVCGKTEEH